METNITTTTVITLTEDEVKKAIAKWVNERKPIGIKPGDVELDAEMSDPDTLGKVTAKCTKTSEEKV